MNVQKISVSLRKQTIKALNEAAAKEKRSRSQYIQLVLEAHLRHVE
jgi:metal-responsive CopG/Arc/MetJ family transcriptional regulator